MDEKSISQTMKLLTTLVLVMLSVQVIFGIVVIYQVQRIEQSIHNAMIHSDPDRSAKHNVNEDQASDPHDPLAEMRTELERLKAMNQAAEEKYGHMPGFRDIFEDQDKNAATQPKPSNSDSSSADDPIKKMMEQTERMRKENERNKDLIKQLPGFEDFDPNEPVPTTQADSASVDPEALFQMIKEKNREHGIQMEDHHIRLIVQKLIEDPDSVLPEPKILDPDSLEDLSGSENSSSNASE